MVVESKVFGEGVYVAIDEWSMCVVSLVWAGVEFVGVDVGTPL